MTVTCDEIYDIFHKCSGIFIEAALSTTNPFSLCTDYQAYQSYRNLTFFLNLLQTTQDKRNPNVTCSDEYMNKNSMGVISKIVALTTSLWNNAFCDDCYVNTSSNVQNFTDHTTQFLNLRDQYTNCTRKQHKNITQICADCEDTYSHMNIIFNHQKEKGGRVCFDLEDIVSWCVGCREFLVFKCHHFR
jgi:hypothetical protein